MTKIQETLNERESTHGDYTLQCRYTQRIKNVMRSSTNYREDMFGSHIEALDMIAVKIGRILAGDWQYSDHWHDIAGYATLVEHICKEALVEIRDEKT